MIGRNSRDTLALGYRFGVRNQACNMKIATILLICTWLSGCTRLFFFPMQPHVSVPSELGYDYQDIFLQASDGTRLHAWLINPDGPPLGTVLFLHGNAENVSTHYRATLWLIDAGYRVFILDYRGYGLSQGKADLPDVFLDIDAAAQWIDTRFRNPSSTHSHPVFLVGQSLGASLAIKYAEQNAVFKTQFDALVVEAAFARFGTIARHVASKHWLTWSAQYPVQWLLGRQYDPLDAIGRLDDTPILLIHSEQDQIIPYHFGKSLYDEAREPKRMITTTGPHIRAFAQRSVRRQVLDFLSDHQPARL